MQTIIFISFLFKIFHYWFFTGNATEVMFPNVSYISIAIFELIVLFSAFRLIRSQRIRFWCMFGANVSFGILLQGIYMYYRLFAIPLSFSLILFWRNIGDISSSIFAMINPSDLTLYSLDLIVLLMLRSKKLTERFDKTDEFFFSISPRKWLVVAIILIAIWSSGVEPQGSWREPFAREEIEAIVTFSPLGYCFLELARGIRDSLFVPQLDNDKRETIIRALNQEKVLRQRAKETIPWVENGKISRPNIIIIQVESFMYGFFQTKIGGKSVLPNLDKIASQSVFLPSFYSTAIATSDSDFSTLTSLFPHEKKVVHLSYFENSFESLPRVFRPEGYFTIYGNIARKTFWNMGVFMKNLGFEQLIFSDSLTPGKHIGHGLNDLDFLNQVSEKLASIPQPFFGMFLTSSSHHPFYDENLPVNIEADGNNSAEIQKKRYANAINYTDHAIGNFVSRLESSGLLKNSIIIIYGDHPMMLECQETELRRTYGKIPGADKVMRFFNSNIPCMIYSPEILRPEMINKLCTQVDLAPTILSLCGIPQPERFIGTSVFSDIPGFAFHKYFIGCNENKFSYGREFEKRGFHSILNRHTLMPEATDEQIERIFDLGQASEWMIEYNYQ